MANKKLVTNLNVLIIFCENLYMYLDNCFTIDL